VEGILAPPAQLAEYLNRFNELGIQEVMITPLAPEGGLERFVERFESEVRPLLPAT
jgi:hypothetical protein